MWGVGAMLPAFPFWSHLPKGARRRSVAVCLMYSCKSHLPLGPGRSARACLLALALLLAGCQTKPAAQAERLERLELRLQQLEQRQNQERQRHDGADRSGKPPAGVIKSLTLRSGTDDDRLRIYWANGSTTDLPCTKEQATLVCG